MNFKNFKIYIGFKDLNKRVNYVKKKDKNHHYRILSNKILHLLCIFF